MFNLTVTDIRNIILSSAISATIGAIWYFYRHVTMREEKRQTQKRAVSQGLTDDRLERLERARQVRMARSRGLGALLVLLGVLVGAIFFVVELFAPKITSLQHLPVQGTMVGLFLIVPGLLVTRGRRMRSKGANPSLAEGPPLIVYLRPFMIDRLENRSPMGGKGLLPKTSEQKIARTLRRVAPFIGIGDPRDELPPLGAGRIYTEDEHWQETVEDLTRRAGTIILPVYLRPGDSAGFAWEVEHVVALGQPERIILILRPLDHRSPSALRNQYEIFRGKFAHLFPRGLPDDIGTNNLLCFDADWTPRLFGRFQAPDGYVPPGSSGQQRVLVVRRLHASFNNMSNKVLYGVMAVFLWLGVGFLCVFVLFPFLFRLFVLGEVKNPLSSVGSLLRPTASPRIPAASPTIPAGYVQFQDGADHLSIGVPANWWQIDPASPDAHSLIQKLIAANPALGALLGSSDPDLKFLKFFAGSQGATATVGATVTIPTQPHPDDDLPSPESMKSVYEMMGGTVVGARNVTIAGHKALQLEVDLPSSALGQSRTAHITQDILVANGLLYAVNFAGNESERTTIESTLSLS
jgi:hypothetical protein